MKVFNKKVAIIGTGFVGTSIAYSMINQGIANELILVDIDKAKSEGEAIDLLDGVPWGQENVNVWAGDYQDCQDADIVVITAGANQKPGQSRLDLVSINAEIMKTIVNNIMKSGFDGILVIASNPVDVLTYVAWQASGLPVSRVIGTGTTLDTTRFRKELSQRLAIDPRNVHGYIIGEHGDSEVAVWSHTMIGTKPILEIVDTTERLTSDDLPIISDKVKNTAYEIIDRKQATYYGIGMSTARIVKAILNNEQAILPVSAYLDGQYGQQDVFTGIPAVVGNQGVTDIIELNLNAAEKELFQKSVTQLKQVMASLQPNA